MTGIIIIMKTVACQCITIITTMFLDIITDVVMFQDTNVERLGLSTLIVTDLDIIITNPYIISLLKQEKGGKKFAVIFRPQGFS